MKKLIVVLAAVVGLLVVQEVTAGDVRNVPSAGDVSAINADYGGVDLATNSFYVGLATVPSENGPQGIGYQRFYASTTTRNNLYSQQRWTVYGINFSSGLCNPAAGPDFVSVRTSSSSAGQSREIWRFSNHVFISTMANGNVCGGPQLLAWPVRAYGNLFWGVNYDPLQATAGANPYNNATLLYYREEQ